MPLKPAVFYGRDVIIEEITQLLVKEETSRVCILGPKDFSCTVSMAKAFGNKEYIALSLWCLGETYGYLGEFYASYDYVQEAYQLYNSLLPVDPELQLLCYRCGILMVDVARFTFEDGASDKFPWPMMLKNRPPPFSMTIHMLSVC